MLLLHQRSANKGEVYARSPQDGHRGDSTLSVVLNLAIYTEKKGGNGRFQGYGLNLGLISRGGICYVMVT